MSTAADKSSDLLRTLKRALAELDAGPHGLAAIYLAEAVAALELAETSAPTLQ